MAINFPDNPVNGQNETLAGKLYTYNSATTSWLLSTAGSDIATAVATSVATLVDSDYVAARVDAFSVTVLDTAPTSPSNGDQWFNSTDGSLNVYYNDGSSSQWVVVSGPAGPAGAAGSSSTPTSYANLAAFPSSGNTAGDFGFATDTKAVYVWDGTEWDRVYTDANAVPEWTTVPPSTANLASDGTATNQTVVASDPEGFPIEYSYDTNPSNQAQATISNTAGAFTITPSTTEADAGDFILRYKATDGLHTTSRSTTYTLSFYTNPDIANASNDNDTFSFSGQDANARGIFFKPDGTKIYMTGIGNNSVHQYSLSTPWLVSSTSYDNVGFNFLSATNMTSARDLAFKPDGTKMYIVGSSTDSIFEFDLSTAWDVSTTTYNNVNLDVSSENATATGLTFSTDGLKMFMIGSTVPDDVSEYDLSTAWDLSTATHNNVTFEVTTQEPGPLCVRFNPSGTKMYVTGTTDKIYEYDLSTGFDISTASYNNVFASISADPASMALKPDGRKIYFMNYSNDDVYTYSV